MTQSEFARANVPSPPSPPSAARIKSPAEYSSSSSSSSSYVLALYIYVVASGCLLLTVKAAAFPDWTDCPAVCRCKWTSGKKSALCPDAGLTSLPATLDPDMQVLDLSGNQIPELQAEIFKHAGLLNLQRVFLRNAGIHQIHGDAFKDMRILIEVDLSDNHLTSLEQHTFAGNERLKLLVLSGNPLRILKQRQFPVLQHLRNLELQRCALNKVHAQAFQWLPALETLSLDNNELEYLEATTITSLKRLKTLGLDNNPWSCDCHLRDFSRLLTTGSLLRLYSVSQQCISPIRLQGRRWEEVKFADFACEPTVYLPVSQIQEEMNGNVTLACLATGDPEPEIWWQLNGGPVNGTKRPPDEVGPPGGLVTYSTSLEARGRLIERWSNLTIYNASDIDAGEYTCHARNIAGTARDTVTVSIPRVFTAPTLSQTDNWLLWLSLAGGGTVALCISASAVLVAMCLCGSARRRSSRRAKVKLQASTSFGDQEKKLLDLSVTTTATTTSQQHLQHNQNQHAHPSPPLQVDMNHCQPEFELELEPRLIPDHICNQSASSASVTIERLRLQSPSGLMAECQTPPLPPTVSAAQSVLCPVAVAQAAARALSPALPANIYISVSLASQDSPRAHQQQQQPVTRQAAPSSMASVASSASAAVTAAAAAAEVIHETYSERCYPDLLDIGLSSFATLPRRNLGSSSSICGNIRRNGELGSPYDNMGPRVTATGSSTFSLVEQPELESAAALQLAAVAPLIQPPPEFVSL